MKVKILGTKYNIETKDLNEQCLAQNDGICEIYDKKIILRQKEFMAGNTNKAQKERYDHVLRHELVHAIAKECGVAYGDDEELVDWIAHIIPIVNKAEKKLKKSMKTSSR